MDKTLLEKLVKSSLLTMAAPAAVNIIGALYAKNVLDKWLANNDLSLVGHHILQYYVNDFKR